MAPKRKARWGRRIALTFASLVLLLIGWWTIAPYVIPPVSSKCTPFTITLRAEGNDYALTTTVWNGAYRTNHPLAYNGTHHVSRPKWMTQRLPSGASVLIPVPHHELRALRRAQDLHQIAAAYPYVYVFDDPAEPQAVEAYVSETYYAGPAPRVLITGIEVGATVQCDRPDDPKDIPWAQKEHKDRFLRSTYAAVIPREEWQDIPELAAQLSALTQFTSLEAADLEAGLRKLPNRQSVPNWAPRSDIMVRAGQDFPGRNQPHPAATHRFARPIRIIDGQAVLLLDQPGMIVYYSEEARPSTRDGLLVGSRTVKPAKRKWNFDPETGILFQLGTLTLS